MKDCTTCKYGFADERLGIPMCHHPLRFSKDCIDFNLHEEKEEPKKVTGIEEKKLPDGLEEAAKEYFKPEWSGSLIDAFIAGAEWGAAHARKEE